MLELKRCPVCGGSMMLIFDGDTGKINFKHKDPHDYRCVKMDYDLSCLQYDELLYQFPFSKIVDIWNKAVENGNVPKQKKYILETIGTPSQKKGE